jgi:hypothetical protein
VGGDINTLAELMLDVAYENGLKSWGEGSTYSARKSGARRSLSQLLEGHNTVSWVMDIIDTACEELL